MRRILILYNNWSGKCVTGGQFYEEYMYQCMVENPEIEVERFSINRKKSFTNKLFSPISNLKCFSKCTKFDLVIFNSVVGWYFIPLVILLRLFSKTKVAIVHHHFLYLEFTGIKRFFYKNLESSFLKLSNYIITVSPYIQELCNNKFNNKNIRIWPIPFSDKIYEVTPNQKKEGSLIYIGTIEPRKGLVYLMQALSILKKQNIKFTLQIVGKIRDQKYYDELKKIIDKNELNVNFSGFVDESKKNQLLKESEVFVFPSLLEGYGMVLREVMSYGLPIVCFNNSAMPYLVKDKINGILVENKNSKEMAEAISSILTDNELQASLSKGAYKTTKETITPKEYKILLSSELRNMI